MKTTTKLLRKFKRLLGWRKPHPKYVTRQFNMLVLNTARSMKRRKRVANPASVRFIETLWLGQK